MLRSLLVCAAAATTAFTGTAFAEALKTYELVLKGDVFTPAEIKVPAGAAFMIKMKNENAAPAELEAKLLKIEKVAAGQSSIVVRVRGLDPGKYLFVDEFQEQTAKGYVIAE